MKVNRLIILFTLLMLVLSACNDGATPDSQLAEQEMVTLKMNSAPFTSYAPVFIANEEGYFEDEGIKLEFVSFNRTSDALPLIVTGDLDIFAGSLNAGLLNTLGQEDNIKVVADRGWIFPGEACVYQGVLFRKDLYESGELTGPADLEGRTIISQKAGASGYVLSLYLAQAGLTLDDVNFGDIPPAGYVDAFSNGTVDAYIGPELRLSQILNGGNAVLVASGADIYGSIQSSVVVFGKNLLVDNREVGVRFLTAYLKGVRQYNEGKTDRNVEILVKYTQENEDVIRSACWPAINQDGRINFEEGVTGFQQWNIDQGYLDNPVTEEQFWNPSLLEEALKELDN